MVVVDSLNEWLDLRSLFLAFLRHSAGDLRWVTFNASDQGVREWVGFRAGVKGLNDDNLETSLSACHISHSGLVLVEYANRVVV